MIVINQVETVVVVMAARTEGGFLTKRIYLRKEPKISWKGVKKNRKPKDRDTRWKESAVSQFRFCIL